MRPTGNWSPARAERETALAFSLFSVDSLVFSVGAVVDLAVAELAVAFSGAESADLFAFAAASDPVAGAFFLGGILQWARAL